MPDLTALHDFDFLRGTWRVQNRRLRARLVWCEEWDEFQTDVVSGPLLDGRGSLDTYHGDSLSAVALRLLDPTTGDWSIYWADGSTAALGEPVRGRFDGDAGEFFGDDSHDGRAVRVRFRWRKVDGDHATWEQAFSVDGGATWETNWTMAWTRRNGES